MAAAFDSALALAGDSPDLTSYLGAFHAQNDMLEPAIPLLEAAVRQNPLSVRGWTNLGLALIKAGRRPEGIAALRESLRIQPDQAAIAGIVAPDRRATLTRPVPVSDLRWTRARLLRRSAGLRVTRASSPVRLRDVTGRGRSISRSERADPRSQDLRGRRAASTASFAASSPKGCSMLHLPPEHRATLERLAAEAFPAECCGVLGGNGRERGRRSCGP